MKKSHPIPNTASLVEACKNLGISYSFYDDNHNLVGVNLDQEYFFANTTTPFNDESFVKISKDKEFSYKIVSQIIAMPRTQGFLDPYCDPEYASYVKYPSHKDIVREIDTNFSYPVIIKKNSGAQGNNIFKCADKSAVAKALKIIYTKKTRSYDYVALAQECLHIAHEFRVVVFQGEIVLVYEKDFSKATITDNISPLHQANSKTVVITDKAILDRLSAFITPLSQKMYLGFIGLDIVIDDKGELWLLELNTKLGFRYFVRDNGNSLLVKMYEKMLLFLKEHPQVLHKGPLQEEPSSNQDSQNNSIPHEAVQSIRLQELQEPVDGK
jgi:glutathione synthase/RimK-type ligase-like ATP-grasp enzyme